MKNVVNIPSPLSTLNGRQLCRLYQFLNNNGQYRLLPTPEDGDCFYGAFRRSTNLPYDVADVHIRRLILKAICNNHEFFFNLYKCSLAQTYGCDRDPEEELARRKADAQYLREQRMPGPFSFMTYLRYMLKNSSYADIHIMMTASMMWNLQDHHTICRKLYGDQNPPSQEDSPSRYGPGIMPGYRTHRKHQ